MTVGVRRPWVLHFDVNETILVGDEAGGDSFEHSINKIIAKSALVRHDFAESHPSTSTLKHFTPTHWCDGSPLIVQDIDAAETDFESQSQPDQRTVPPLLTDWNWPAQCCPYYLTAYKHVAHHFTELGCHGHIYRHIYHQIRQSLQCQPPFTHMLPAFFHTLYQLQNQTYTLVLRTFGTDLQTVALALRQFAQGRHPLYPDYQNPNLMLDTNGLFRGRWTVTSPHNKNIADDDIQLMQHAQYQLFAYDDVHMKTPLASGDQQVRSFIENRHCLGIQDDYDFWNRHHKRPWAGKPIWVRKQPYTECHHLPIHIFFDDNIHNSSLESIVAIRCETVQDTFISLDGDDILQHQSTTTFRVPTVQAILNTHWFLDQIYSISKSNTT
jgi:hypothetical protein